MEALGGSVSFIWQQVRSRWHWLAGLLLLVVVVTAIMSQSSPASPAETEDIIVTYEGGTHPVFNLTMKLGYNPDVLRQSLIDYLNDHDPDTLCGVDGCQPHLLNLP